MNTLTKREKFLIFVAIIVFLIFAVFQLGINPLYKNYIESTDEYNTLYAEKQFVENKIKNEEKNRTNYQKIKKQYENIEKRYPALIPSEEVDKILTDLCVKNNLKTTHLGLSTPVEYIWQPEKNTIRNIPQNVAVSNENSPSQPEEEKPVPAFVIVTATMNLNGTYNAMKNLVNAVDKIDYIRITQLSLSGKQVKNANQKANISVIFEVTMRNMQELGFRN